MPMGYRSRWAHECKHLIVDYSLKVIPSGRLLRFEGETTPGQPAPVMPIITTSNPGKHHRAHDFFGSLLFRKSHSEHNLCRPTSSG
jgi:hypothetical protein